jgi:uncharacterized protein YjeT (DUF2065 family)
MTTEEKKMVKAMNQLMANAYLRAMICEGVLMQLVPGGWQNLVAAAKTSPAFETLRTEIEQRRQDIDFLIEQNNLSALLSKLPKGGPVN